MFLYNYTHIVHNYFFLLHVSICVPFVDCKNLAGENTNSAFLLQAANDNFPTSKLL